MPRLVYNAVGAGYPVPRNLNYLWNFGVLAGFCLVLQIVTGVVLAMHYAANAQVAFASVEHIMRDVNWGWLMRYAHANGASFFFVVIYLHIFRGFFYASYKAAARDDLAARRGHLPADDGDRLHGLRAAVGPDELLGRAGHHRPVRARSRWSASRCRPGCWAASRRTTPRSTASSSLHFLLPFVIAGVVILHIWALHIPGLVATRPASK